jgi:hypothetical protein
MLIREKRTWGLYMRTNADGRLQRALLGVDALYTVPSEHTGELDMTLSKGRQLSFSHDKHLFNFFRNDNKHLLVVGHLVFLSPHYTVATCCPLIQQLIFNC